jgi:hypothetical protein
MPCMTVDLNDYLYDDLNSDFCRTRKLDPNGKHGESPVSVW